MVQQLVDQAQWEEVVNSGKYVLIDFTATWCGPCKRIAPYFEEFAASLPEDSPMLMAKVDVDENIFAEKAAGIAVMPTFQVWKDGVRIEYFEGASEEKLEQLFTKYLHMSSSENPTANA